MLTRITLVTLLALLSALANADNCPEGRVSANDLGVINSAVAQLVSEGVTVEPSGTSGFCYGFNSQEQVATAVFLAMQVHEPTVQKAIGGLDVASSVLAELHHAGIPHLADRLGGETTIHLPAEFESAVDDWLQVLLEH